MELRIQPPRQSQSGQFFNFGVFEPRGPVTAMNLRPTSAGRALRDTMLPSTFSLTVLTRLTRAPY